MVMMNITVMSDGSTFTLNVQYNLNPNLVQIAKSFKMCMRLLQILLKRSYKSDVKGIAGIRPHDFDQFSNFFHLH